MHLCLGVFLDVCGFAFLCLGAEKKCNFTLVFMSFFPITSYAVLDDLKSEIKGDHGCLHNL